MATKFEDPLFSDDTVLTLANNAHEPMDRNSGKPICRFKRLQTLSRDEDPTGYRASGCQFLLQHLRLHLSRGAAQIEIDSLMFGNLADRDAQQQNSQAIMASG